MRWVGLSLLALAAADYTCTFNTDVPVGDGRIVVRVRSAWAPLGAAHLQKLLHDSFFDGAAFFRVVPDFVVQFGIAGLPAENKKWSAPISDDPVVSSNVEGSITYATAGPNTRTTQLFINLKDNARLDKSGFAPFGTVVSGMDVVRAIHNPTPGSSDGVDQGNYSSRGDSWIRKAYPGINFVTNATISDSDIAQVEI